MRKLWSFRDADRHVRSDTQVKQPKTKLRRLIDKPLKLPLEGQLPEAFKWWFSHMSNWRLKIDHLKSVLDGFSWVAGSSGKKS